MLKLGAPTGFIGQYVYSDENHPESLCGTSGPGWSWMCVHTPFNSQHVQARFTTRVFRQRSTAHADLRSFIGGMGSAGDDPKRLSGAVSALGRAPERDFVLVCSRFWAFASFEVRSGASPAAGTDFYNSWVSTVNADPRIAQRLLTAKKPEFA